MNCTIEDLGPQVFADIWLNWRMARDPATGAEVMLGSLANSGFMIIDPREQKGIQVRLGHAITSGWAIGQAPDGAIYQCGFSSSQTPNALLRWNWRGETSTKVAEVEARAVFTLDVAPDGRVYMPDSRTAVLYRHNPATNIVENLGDFTTFSAHMRNVYCGRDGLVYLFCTDYTTNKVVVFDPRTGAKAALAEPDGGGIHNWQYGNMIKDGAGRILLPSRRWGRSIYWELVGGRPQPIDQQLIQLSTCPDGRVLPFAFSDGSYIAKIDDDTARARITYVDARGSSKEFDVVRDNAPIRIFSLQNGGGRVWGSTFIPLTLFSHDPATGKVTAYGNPTQSTGETYSMLYSHDKLFMASYTGATLTRFSPGRPWRRDASISANPAHLGNMKNTGLPLQRPYGKAVDSRGNVFFAARGDYGCRDSGICRIDPDTEEITRWIYPDTVFAAMTYLPQIDQLLVSEQRDGENEFRFTFVDPHDGRIITSEIVIHDKGQINSWLHDGADLVYGLYAHRATLFAFSLKANKIVSALPEMQFGDHCHECLLFGPDGEILGLTNRGIYAARRDLSSARMVATYKDHASMNFYRFGMVQGPDGNIYFPNGQHLMRLTVG